MILKASLRLFSLLALAGGLSACFQPVNGMRIGNSSVSAELAQVSVSSVGSSFLGYALKSELDYLLGNGTSSGDKRYVLSIRLYQSKDSSIIDAAAARPQSVALQAEASYELRDLKTGIIRASGKTFGTANYDRSSQRFATIRAQRDAEERLGKSLAERLRILVSAGLLGDPKRDSGPAPQLTTPLNTPWATPPEEEPGDET